MADWEPLFCNTRGGTQKTMVVFKNPLDWIYIYESLDVLDRGAARAQGDGREVLVVVLEFGDLCVGVRQVGVSVDVIRI